jgi:isopenicillin N synthase-like dioxygenase
VNTFGKFFKQPLEVKTQHLRGMRRDFGYTPIGQERPNLERPGDFKESFNYQPADDPNDWANNDFPSACREMFNDCEILGYRMLDALSIALGQNQTFLR